jgi:hypothetical protein
MVCPGVGGFATLRLAMTAASEARQRTPRYDEHVIGDTTGR